MMKAIILALLLATAAPPITIAPAMPLEASLSALNCLGNAAHYEARGEAPEGRKAVLDVIVNRAIQAQRGVCDVLYERGQFQWTKRKAFLDESVWAKTYTEAMQAKKMLTTEHRWFYAVNIPQPVWAKKMVCKRVGRHWFCKENNRV